MQITGWLLSVSQDNTFFRLVKFCLVVHTLLFTSLQSAKSEQTADDINVYWTVCECVCVCVREEQRERERGSQRSSVIVSQ